VKHETDITKVQPPANIPIKPPPEATSLPVEPGEALREPKGAGSPVIRIVKAGDTLSRLIADVYGYSNKELITFVTESNTGIYDANRIMVGDQILFPTREKNTQEGI
jgi:nucleoid-associated protein YgaU